MRVLLYSGLLYILGIGIILAIRPSFMFTNDGGWKEFGIGRNPERFTWFPFWLFTIVWAVVSFFTIQVLAATGILPGVSWTPIETATPAPVKNSRNNKPTELKPGYYILNTEGTTAEGVPKYIYIGENPDNA